jgi:hypothetical protein
MADAQVLARRGLGETERRDAWWTTPIVVFIVFAAFIVYSTWAALQNAHYTFGPYLSPFYSPEIFGDSPHAWFGPKPAWWPAIVPFSPAILILWAPGGFRFTCYYYRGAYYKAFWADPPSCAVGEPRKSYRGENSFPLIFQNIHRYFLYLALLFLVVLAYDAWKGLWFVHQATGRTTFGIGLGSILLIANVVCLAAYTFGCHSLRHLVGGRVDCLSGKPGQLACYRGVSRLNRAHMHWAWTSLFMVAFADIYIRLCSMGIWTDWRLL